MKELIVPCGIFIIIVSLLFIIGAIPEIYKSFFVWMEIFATTIIVTKGR